MKTVRVARRQLLRGAGGFTLSLPFLPSILPGPAYGVAYAASKQVHFAAMSTVHGAVIANNMQPSQNLLTQSMPLYPNHTIKSGPLPTNTSNLSAVLNASSGVLTPKLMGKMNVLRGFDIPFYIGHHTGGHLGNFVRSDQGPQDLQPFASIDQVMAYSNSFYKDLSSVKVRSIVAGSHGFGSGISFTWGNPTNRSGGIQGVDQEPSNLALFNKLFMNGVPSSMPTTPTAPARPPIVDLVLANYNSLRQSNRRLSTSDKQRLDNHLSRLQELQRTLTVTTPTTGSGTAQCKATKPSTDDGDGQSDNSAAGGKKFFGLLNDVIAAAFSCGASSVATLTIGDGQNLNSYNGDWHQDVAHNAGDPNNQRMLTSGMQCVFEGALTDLASKLDAIDAGDGTTVLDNSLLQWTQEAGWETHTGQDLTHVTYGSAGGFLKTGLYCDFRNLNAHIKLFGSFSGESLGLMHRQWLATALQAVGVPKSEFEANGKPGYGDPYMDPGYTPYVASDVYNKASDIVPFLKA